MVRAPRIDRRAPPEISERLQYFGGRVVRSSGSGGPDRLLELVSVDDGAIKYADERIVLQDK